MATSKTDIEQSVGRILREKHSQPIVVDIIDSHDLFQKQWLKRKTFYKKQNYKIVYTTNIKYLENASNWEVEYDPACKKVRTKSSEKDELPSKCLIKLKK
jgi:UDP-N-acetylglucosamine pyrophosphorylase